MSSAAPAAVPNGGTAALAPAHARGWALRGATAMVDQGLISGSTFLANVLLARWLGGASYGAFALTFAALLFLGSFHNALLLEPLTVLAASKYRDRLTGYFADQLIIHLCLTLPAAVALAGAGAVLRVVGVGGPMPLALIGGGVAVPCLLLLWVARRFLIIVGRPHTSLIGTGVYVTVMVAGFALLDRTHRLSPLTAFLLISAASVIAAVVLLGLIGIPAMRRDRAQSPARWRTSFKENVMFGRWLAAQGVLHAASTQAQILCVSSLLGVGVAGALRAMETAMLPMHQIIGAIGTLALPALAAEYGRGSAKAVRRHSHVLSAALAIVALGYAILLWAGAGRVEQLLYGGRFAAYAWLLPLLALVPLLSGLTVGYSVGLRAARRPEHYLVVGLVTGPFGVASAFVCTQRWGLAGAVASSVLTSAATALVTAFLFYWWVFRPAERPHANMKGAPA